MLCNMEQKERKEVRTLFAIRTARDRSRDLFVQRFESRLARCVQQNHLVPVGRRESEDERDGHVCGSCSSNLSWSSG